MCVNHLFTCNCSKHKTTFIKYSHKLQCILTQLYAAQLCRTMISAETQQFVTVASFFQRKASVCSSFPSRPSAPNCNNLICVSMVFSLWSHQNDLVGNVGEKLLNLWESERNVYNPAGESVFKWNRAEGCHKTVLITQALNVIIQRSNYWHF